MSSSPSRRPRPFSSAPVLLLALACSLTTPGARAAEAPYALAIDPVALRADARGMWEMRLQFFNRSATGAYLDSLSVEWASDARGTDGAPASGRTDLSALARSMEATSANDSGEVHISIPAECARGRLTLSLWLHDASKKVSSVTAEASVTGSDLEDHTPATLLTAAGRAAELILVRPDSAAWPAPTLLVLPPAGVRARSLVRWSLGIVERGYAVALLGPPGAGGSKGPDDRSGPASVAAVAAALTQLAREPACDARRTLLWGEAEGASTALLAAASQKTLAGVVSLDARMDPWADYRAMDTEQKAAYVTAAGRDSAAWRARAPLEVAARIPAPVLVLHTDRAGPSSAAAAFVQKRGAAGLPVESRLNGQDPRPLRRPDTSRLWMDFLTRMTRAAKP